MSLTWFPDLIGPVNVAANGGTAIGIRRRRLNVLTTGVTGVDNVAKRRIDLTIPNPAWSVYSTTLIFSGEWLPASHVFGTADLIRIEASAGALLNGFDSGPDPVRLVKYIANTGFSPFVIQPPSAPIAGKQYFTGPAYTLGVNETVRVTWDAVDRVYRIRGAAIVAPPVTSLIVLDGSPLALGSSHITNPT